MRKALKAAALVFLGGALGSGLRYLISLGVEVGPMLLVVNTFGALLLGAVNAKAWPSWVQPFIGTGVAGGFTTLSGVSLFMNAHLASEPLSTLVAVGTMLVLGFATYWLGAKAVRVLS
jgi:fluoride exporter